VTYPDDIRKYAREHPASDEAFLVGDLDAAYRALDEQRRIINEQREWLRLWTARCDRILAAAKRTRATLKQGTFLRIEE
jgi:hypothetical protein